MIYSHRQCSYTRLRHAMSKLACAEALLRIFTEKMCDAQSKALIKGVGISDLERIAPSVKNHMLAKCIDLCRKIMASTTELEKDTISRRAQKFLLDNGVVLSDHDRSIFESIMTLTKNISAEFTEHAGALITYIPSEEHYSVCSLAKKLESWVTEESTDMIFKIS